MIVFLMSTAVQTILPVPVFSQDNDASVVLAHLMYENERWSLGQDGVLVLPCEAPSKFINGSEGDPLIKVLGTKGEALYQRHMRNPRFILIEEPSSEPPLLEKVSFKLRFALVDGMEKLEFWYDPLKQNEPSVTVGLSEAIQEYIRRGGSNQKASCQQPVPEKYQF